MRIVFVGASELSLGTARILIERDDKVVIIERDRQKIDDLTEKLDCSFLHGDGSKPHILEEADPKDTDILFCLTDDDQDNIIASLVGRSLGFKRVVTSIRDPEFGSICRELGLKDTITPSRTISRYLADMARGVDVLELSTILKHEARFFTFIAEKEHAGTVSDLDLPEEAKVVCFFRDGGFYLAGEDSKLSAEDEVVILTHSKNLPDLQEQFKPKQSADEGD